MIRFLALFAVFLIPASDIFSQPPQAGVQYVGIPTDEFNFVAAAQTQDEWCWAASVSMILRWYRLDISQELVVARTKGVLIDQPGSDQDISTALSGWAYTRDGKPVVISSWTAPGAPPPLILIRELSQKHPILLTFISGPSSGHAVVITAASYIQTANGPYIQSLVLRDPWPSQQNIMNEGRVEIGAQNLANFMPFIRSNWLVSVSPN
ncbi:MAG TPA: papain-like cysteine protease family protein [Candidatus Acidoferrum sp.]|nr:papain-like cysteine protease family protein [Candidatus Acidoferrum sp.]